MFYCSSLLHFDIQSAVIQHISLENVGSLTKNEFF